VTPVTGSTITLKQIYELHDWAGTQRNKRRLEKSCLVVLSGATAEDLRRGETQQVARERCAVAYNVMVAARGGR
jgi:hypothetical protein